MSNKLDMRTGITVSLEERRAWIVTDVVGKLAERTDVEHRRLDRPASLAAALQLGVVVGKRPDQREAKTARTLEELHKLYGPLFIWVVLDGFMTRDVQ